MVPGKSPIGKKQFDLQGQSGASAATPEDEYEEYYYDEEDYGEE